VPPAELGRRLGMGEGARFKLIEEVDGVRLSVVRRLERSDFAALGRMAIEPSRGAPRSLEDFDAASILARENVAWRS